MDTLACQAQASLDLTTGPIWRVVLADRDPQPPWLLVVCHHLTADTVSWQLLVEDLQLAYQQLAAGQPVELGPKTSSVGQWANWLDAQAHDPATQAELAYWTHPYRAKVDPLPVDLPATTPATLAQAATHYLCLDQDQIRRLLRAAPAAYRTRIDTLSSGQSITEYSASSSWATRAA